MGKTLRKQIISIFMILVFIITFMPILTTEVNAAAKTTENYSSAKALAYAKAHWDDGGKDCVVFVRACLEAGGVPRDTSRSYGYTPQQYMNYLINNNYAVKYELKTSNYYSDYYGININDNEGKIAKGDVILYYCNNKDCPKRNFHMSISNGTGHSMYKEYITCYAHNVGVNNGMACKIRHKKCGAAKNTITMYALHIKSAENGYTAIDAEAIANLKAQKPELTVAAAKKAVKLTWSAVDNTNGYKVYRSTTLNGTYKLVKTVKSGDTTTYTNTGLTGGKKYYYKVRAYNNDGFTFVYSTYSAKKSATTKK